jgi:sugar phosphate permease
MVAAGLFAWLADEEAPLPPVSTDQAAPKEKMFATPALWLLFIGASFCFSLRDFAGSSMGSLSSLFLQNARGHDVDQTGRAVSAIFIASAISNPLFGHLSDGGRKRWTCGVLVVAAVILFIFPRVPANWIIPTLLAYGFFFLANYPMVEAALMESVPDSVRGRVFGLFITIGGFVGNLSHWLAGRWVEALGPAKGEIAAYYPLYGRLAVLIFISLGGLLCLHALRRREMQGGAVPSEPMATPEPVVK